MRTSLLAALLVVHASIGESQPANRFVSRDYQNFYNWFHQQSQVGQLYNNKTTLYIFGFEARVYAAPRRNAPLVTHLALGQSVTNLAYDERYVPKDRIDGYNDMWFHVSGTDPQGRPFSGYVWGADIARGWRQDDITGDGYPEFILLGISSRPRTAPSDINAELRVLQDGVLIEQRLVPGLCLFEECDTSPLLRILHDQAEPGLIIIETSTMTIGCEVGIEKAFFFWNGRKLERVFHAEFTTQHEFERRNFSFPIRDINTGLVTAQRVCQYSREDEFYNPVWQCQTVPAVPVDKPDLPADKARAR